jgi:hypothetical protein
MKLSRSAAYARGPMMRFDPDEMEARELAVEDGYFAEILATMKSAKAMHGNFQFSQNCAWMLHIRKRFDDGRGNFACATSVTLARAAHSLTLFFQVQCDWIGCHLLACLN